MGNSDFAYVKGVRERRNWMEHQREVMPPDEQRPWRSRREIPLQPVTIAQQALQTRAVAGAGATVFLPIHFTDSVRRRGDYVFVSPMHLLKVTGNGIVTELPDSHDPVIQATKIWPIAVHQALAGGLFSPMSFDSGACFHNSIATFMATWDHTPAGVGLVVPLDAKWFTSDPVVPHNLKRGLVMAIHIDEWKPVPVCGMDLVVRPIETKDDPVMRQYASYGDIVHARPGMLPTRGDHLPFQETYACSEMFGGGHLRIGQSGEISLLPAADIQPKSVINGWQVWQQLALPHEFRALLPSPDAKHLREASEALSSAPRAEHPPTWEPRVTQDRYIVI